MSWLTWTDADAAKRDALRKDRAEKHAKLCALVGSPNFALDGACAGCGRNVFDQTDGLARVTYCPFCNASFCD